MDLSVSASPGRLSPSTQQLVQRMSGAITGIAQLIGFVSPGTGDSRLVVAGGELSGVHMLRGTDPPAAGAYHIGGCGLTLDEAVVRTLGESAERYGAMISGLTRPRMVASTSQMRSRGERTLPATGRAWFTEAQLGQAGFPFRAWDQDTTVGWVGATSVPDGGYRWVLGQEALPGYVPAAHEPRVALGVTTGSAAHALPVLALRNALLELVQIDAAMGHWYGGADAVEIASSAGRLSRVLGALQRRMPAGQPAPRWFWLPSADLPGFAVACLVPSEARPFAGVGLGCDTRLDAAVAKSFLEATAVRQLAKTILLRNRLAGVEPDPARLYDLDQNVAYYAAEHGKTLSRRFGSSAPRDADRLPPDIERSPRADVRALVDAFAATGKQLVMLDLTTADVAAAGLCVVRAWSPDVLTLCLPSAPPLAHPRFAAYGGSRHDEPHPYP